MMAAEGDMQRLILIALCALLVGAGKPASSGADDSVPPAHRWTIHVGGNVPSPSFDPTLCTEGLGPSASPHRDGFVASLSVSIRAKGKIDELIWYRGHRLPPGVKRCIAKQLRAAQWPSPPPKHDTYASHLSFIGLTGGLDAFPRLDPEAVSGVLERSTRPAGCLPYGMMAALVGKSGQVLSVAKFLGPTKVTDPFAVNCQLDWVGQLTFPPSEDEGARMAVIDIGRHRAGAIEWTTYRTPL